MGSVPLTTLETTMKKKHFIFVILILFSLTACDNSLQKATQQVLGKEERNTPTPPSAEEESEAEQDEETNTSACPEEDPQPIAVSISEKFDVSYEKVIDWYCDGYIFEDILLALQTSKMSDVEPDTLLKEIEAKTWEEIWEDLGITNPKE